MSDESGRREVCVIAAATLAAVAGGLGYFGWNERALQRERDAVNRPTPAMTAADARALGPATKPRLTRPAVPLAAVPTIVFADGKTTARLAKIERFRAGDHDAPKVTLAVGDPRTAEDGPADVVRVTVEFDDAQPSADQDHLLKIDGVRVAGWSDLKRTRGDPRPSLTATFAVDAAAGGVAIDVAAAVGPFKESQRVALGNQAATQFPCDEGAPLRMETLRRRPEGVLVFCDDDRGASPSEDTSWLMQAVRRDGTRVGPVSVRSGRGSGVQVGFPVEAKDVAHVTYRYRPYEWRSLGVVALPPTATEVARPDPTTPSGG